jgi:hypothetical protein
MDRKDVASVCADWEFRGGCLCWNDAVDGGGSGRFFVLLFVFPRLFFGVNSECSTLVRRVLMPSNGPLMSLRCRGEKGRGIGNWGHAEAQRGYCRREVGGKRLGNSNVVVGK